MLCFVQLVLVTVVEQCPGIKFYFFFHLCVVMGLL